MDDFQFRKLEDRVPVGGLETASEQAYRLLRLEFIKAAMQGILSHQNYDFPPEVYAQWAVRHAEATLAAAGEKGP